MTRLTAVLLASTLIGGALVVPLYAETTPAPPTGTAAPAATTPPSAPDSVAKAADDAAMRQRSAAADHAALFEAHLAALHAGLTLTADQERLWPPVEQAIRGFARMRMAMHDRRLDARQDRADEEMPNEDPIAALKTYSEGLLMRAQALKALSDAADPLYATLSEDQKHRIPMLLRDMTPQRGPVARMVEQLGGEGSGPDGTMSQETQPRDRRGDWRGHEPRDVDGYGWDLWRHGRDDRWGERYGMNDRPREREDGMSERRRDRGHDARGWPSRESDDDAED